MDRRPHHRHATRTAMAAALACACLLAGSAGAERLPDADAVRGPVAPVLFLSARTLQHLPAAPADLRIAGELALDDALRASGASPLDAGAVMDLRMRHRVRSDYALAPAFLSDLRDEHGIERLLVVQLLFDAGRVLPAGRLVDTLDGRLLGAGTLEPEVWDDDDWSDAAERAVAGLVARLDASPERNGGEPLVVLPVRARGIARGDVITATHAVLETVLADGHVALYDPGVLNHALIHAGHDPRSLDADGMAELAEAFGAGVMLATEIVSYDARSGAGAIVIEDDTTAAPAVLPSFSCFARLTDLRSGTLEGCMSLYHDDQPRYGWFGTVRTPSSHEVLGDAARRLWRDLGSRTEDPHDQATGSSRLSRGPAADDPGYGHAGGGRRRFAAHAARDRQR